MENPHENHSSTKRQNLKLIGRFAIFFGGLIITLLILDVVGLL